MKSVDRLLFLNARLSFKDSGRDVHCVHFQSLYSHILSWYIICMPSTGRQFSSVDLFDGCKRRWRWPIGCRADRGEKASCGECHHIFSSSLHLVKSTWWTTCNSTRQWTFSMTSQSEREFLHGFIGESLFGDWWHVYAERLTFLLIIVHMNIAEPFLFTDSASQHLRVSSQHWNGDGGWRRCYQNNYLYRYRTGHAPRWEDKGAQLQRKPAVSKSELVTFVHCLENLGWLGF